MSGKGKRKLSGGSSSDPRKQKLNNIKDYLSRNGDKVLEKWVSKIDSHPPNVPEMMEFLLDVMESPGVEVAKLYSIVLKRLDYIPITQFMKDFKENARRVKEELGREQFYLVVECSMWSPNDVEKRKSNYFMSILFLCLHPELMDNFIDFACVDNFSYSERQVFPMHGELQDLLRDSDSDTSGTLVYIDDIAFTGTQAEKNLYISWSRVEDRKVIFSPVYASATALENIDKELEYKTLVTITSEHQLKDFKATDIVEEYYLRAGKLDESKVREILRESLDIEDDERFMLYTDMKAPDSLSIFPKALFCLKTKGLTYSIVTGKHPTDEECGDETSFVHDGKVLDTVYKQDDWLDFTDEIGNNRG